jgi:O-methyltransferase involved in polyketide biosynthesis
VVAEGLLMYLDAEAQRVLWRRVADLVAARPGSALVFDLVPAVEQPAPGLAGWVLGRLMRAATKGRGFVTDERTREDLREELLEYGFAEVEVLEPTDLADDARIPALDRRTQVLLFHCRGSDK